jgi:transposase
MQQQPKEAKEPAQDLHLSTADHRKIGFQPWLNIQSAGWLRFGSARTELEVWLRLQRTQVLQGSKVQQAIDYSLNAWDALTLHLRDGAVAIDNNHLERQIKPWKLGAKNWLFVGSELAGQRAAMVMSLVQSAKLNGIDPWAYLRDVLARVHSHPSNRIDELLPHRWQPMADS